MTNSSISFSNRIKISKTLEEVIEPLENGFCRYRDGLSDAAIARQMDFECSAGNVAGVRKHLHGNLRAPVTGNTARKQVDELGVAIMDLQRRVADLERKLWVKP